MALLPILMILNDRNAAIYQIPLPSGARCVKLNEDSPVLSVTDT